MTPPRFSFRRHITYANVMASIAVFVALGGGAYAAVTIDGKDIRNRSIAGKKLKRNTLTGMQINERRLGRVPRATAALRANTAKTAGTASSAGTATTAGSATTADSAGTANSANTANTANSATTAGSADSAKTADSATSADTAKAADSAKSAGSATTAGHADSAGTADSAKTAGSADTAGDADTLNGLTAGQLLVSCPAKTTLFGGVCWDDDPRPALNWIGATITCADAGGRLPSLGELVAYIFGDGDPSTPSHWANDVESVSGGVPSVVRQTDAETFVEFANGSPSGYRCVFYRTN